jgi:hypothetical protein
LAPNGFTLLNRVPSGKFNRVKMNITNQLLKIGILLAKNGFISILKQVTITAVSAIKVHGISRQHTPHNSGDWEGPCPKKKMKMVRNNRPGVANGSGARKNVSQAE